MFKENMIMLSNEFSGVISKVFSTIGFVKTRDLLYGHLGYTDLNRSPAHLLFRTSVQEEQAMRSSPRNRDARWLISLISIPFFETLRYFVSHFVFTSAWFYIPWFNAEFHISVFLTEFWGDGAYPRSHRAKVRVHPGDVHRQPHPLTFTPTVSSQFRAISLFSWIYLHKVNILCVNVR